MDTGEQPPKTSNKASQRDDFPVKAPAISLPKGGGAIQGIGEKFAANPVTGTGSMSVPIATSPGRSGFGPELTISYDSGTGNSIFGSGWNLSLPSITRKTNKGLPQYQDATDKTKTESDVFILSGSEDLVPVLTDDGNLWSQLSEADNRTFRVHRYRPRIEGLFARIERWTNIDNSGDVHWRSMSKDNILTIYGKDENSRISDPTNPRHIFSWLICETRDDKGNGILYEYKTENGNNVDFANVHERNRGDKNDPLRAANRSIRDGQLKPEIQRAWDENLQVYGVKKVWRQLKREGFDIARCTVERLMKQPPFPVPESYQFPPVSQACEV